MLKRAFYLSSLVVFNTFNLIAGSEPQESEKVEASLSHYFVCDCDCEEEDNQEHLAQVAEEEEEQQEENILLCCGKCK